MPTLKELKQKREAFKTQARAIADAAKTMDRELTDDESAKINDLMDSAEAMNPEIEAAETRQRAVERLAQPDVEPGAGPATVQPGQPRVTSVRDNGHDDPAAGFRSAREFLTAVMNASIRDRADERLRPLKATVGSDEQSGLDNQYGGFLVPTAFSPNVLQIGNMNTLGAYTRKIPMAAPQIDIPARTDKDHSESVSGGLVFYRRKETDDISASRMAMERVSLKAESLMGLSYSSEELINDSAISIVALIEQGFADQLGFHLDNERLWGTGVGEFLGVMKSPALVTVSKETGQAADTIVLQNLLKMRAQIWGYQNAIWVANQTLIPQLAQLSLSVGTGGAPVFMTNAQSDVPDMLLGRPIIYSEHAEELGTLGDIMLLNLQEYLEGTYQPGRMDESVHVRFIYNERAFRFAMRNAGAPWWRSALTPKQGDTLSPFVTLQAR